MQATSETRSKQRRSDCPHKYRLISSGRTDVRLYTNRREAQMMLKVEKQMGADARIEVV